MNKHNLNNWKKFSNYLWFNEELNIWIDISKINFNDEDFEAINQKFVNVFNALDEIENGSIANIDENRQDGHKWMM